MKLRLIASRFKAFMLFGIAAVAASAQENAAIPDEHLYQAVFRQVLAMERFGDQIDAKGRDSAKTRSKFRRDAQLTEAEETAVKAIARSFGAADESYHKRQAQLFAALRTPVGRANAAARSEEIHRLQTEHIAMTREHLARLKAALGGARFAALNEYARTQIAPRLAYQRIRVK